MLLVNREMFFYKGSKVSMFKLLAVTPRRLFVLACIAALTAFGGVGGVGFPDISDQQSVSFASGETYEIAGAGIKGPLAFANVTIYPLDTNFDELYDPDKPVLTGTTNAYAEITGLSWSRNAPADYLWPWVLVVDGTNAIDLNTGTVPVIRKLVTIIATRQSLVAAGQLWHFASPYTTLAYQMLRLDIARSGGAEAARGTDSLRATRLSSINEEIIQTLGFGMPAEINIFTTPPVITKATTSIAQQQLVVYYRAGIEALSAIFHEMSLSTDPYITTDTLIQHLALDLYSDGVLDGAENGSPISGLDINIITQDPMFLEIPNTQYFVSETPSLILEEIALVGVSANVPFYIDDIAFVLKPINNDTTPPDDTVSNPVDYLLHADFDNRSIGPYAENDIREDFQVDRHRNWTGNGEFDLTIEYMEIAQDPVDGSTRGNVLKVKRLKDQMWVGKGHGGMSFRADFEKQDDVYMAYDLYLAPDHDFVKIAKDMTLITGTQLEASHPGPGVYPEPEGLNGLSAFIEIEGNTAYNRGDGEVNTYNYDANQIQDTEFWDLDDPGFEMPNWRDTSQGGNQYHMPRGRWVSFMLRVKMNTVNVEGKSGYNDGLMEAWVADPELWNGWKKVSSHNHTWRWTESMGVDGLWMQTYYGGEDNSPGVNKPDQTQYHYYDNFRVSTNPLPAITY